MGMNSEMKACRICGKPLPIASHFNRLYCDDCRRRHRLASYSRSRKKFYQKHSKELLADKREEYHWYKARGICVDCHQRDAAIINGRKMTRCPECMERNRKSKKKKKA